METDPELSELPPADRATSCLPATPAARLHEILAQYEGAQATLADGRTVFVYPVVHGDGLALGVWFDRFGDEARPWIYRTTGEVEALCRRRDYAAWQPAGPRVSTGSAWLDPQ